MKYQIAIALLAALTASAQSNKPVTVNGTLGIQYNSRVTAGARDIYTLDLNYSDSAVFRGTITNTPIIVGTFGVIRNASLNYQLDVDVVNPSNPAQRRNVERLVGVVPITPEGVYTYTWLKVLPIGQGFERAYEGRAEGKPIYKPKGWLDTLKKEAQRFNKGGVSITVTNYDVMNFSGHKMAAILSSLYPEAMVNGRMLYDYSRYTWLFQDVAVNYAVDGVLKVDKISGSIRWLEKPKAGSSRDGEYQFDVRINEPVSEGSTFAGAKQASSEASFFEVDNTIPALTGTMRYRDSFTGEKVTTSSVTIDLKGNGLTRQQGMNLTKLILLSAIVPMNAE